MPGSRQLWTGPSPSALLDRALSEAPADPPALWLVPTALCRERVEEALARRGPSTAGHRAWTWDDLWAEVRARRPKGPGRLSATSARAALIEAIAHTRRDGLLDSLDSLAETAGYRRVVASRLAAWTRAGLEPRGEPPAGAGVGDWAVYRRYRALLKSRPLDAQDAEGFADWASRALKESLAALIGRSGRVVVHDPSTVPGRAVRRAIRTFHERAGDLLVTLPWEGSDDRREVYLDVAPLRDQLLAWGFAETPHPAGEDAPAGLRGLARGLFRLATQAPLDDPEGLGVVGAPRGEGVALAVARAVADRLAAGAEPGDVLVVFPRWDEQADLVVEALRDWSIPACGGPLRRLATESAVSALIRAMSLPGDQWESSGLCDLLRHGLVRPGWPEARDPSALAAAATAIRETRIFRGRDAIRQALRGASVVAPEERDRRALRRADRARLALAVFDRLADALDGLGAPAAWPGQLEKVRALASTLGLDADAGAPALARLFEALEDHAATLDALGRGREVVDWPDFVRDAAALVREAPPTPTPAGPGCVRVATVDEAAGAAARHVVLAGLEEGSFPAREAIDLDPAASVPEGDDEGAPPAVRPADAAFARELRRFLGVAGMARASLSLVYPTTDEKGQSLLAAGFLEDVRRLFSAPAWASCHDARRRLDPILPAELAVAPREARVRAVGLACARGDREALAGLSAVAGQAGHREALAGAAAALRLTHRRSRRSRFGPHDGLLADPSVVRRISEGYGPTRPVFSASQLETLAACPFKFYLRHVLLLEPPDDREEFDEDSTRRGHLMHAALETLHQVLRSEPGDSTPLPDRVRERVEAVIDAQLDRELEPASDVDRGLRAIDAERLRRTGRRYARQFAAYHDGTAAVECHAFEVEFGKEGSAHPGLTLGGESDGLGLQGMIDRIDLVRVDGRVFFRIIDYKTGSCPSRRQVDEGLALQLPLYALAAERLILASEGAEPLDAAYWGLRDEGFKPVLRVAKLDRGEVRPGLDWPDYVRRLEAFVLALVARLRGAEFPVYPREADCTRSCEYRFTCRIGQLRAARKVWPEAPAMPRGERG